MANEVKLKKILPLSWAAFAPPGVRTHSNSQLTGAIVASEKVKLWLSELGGAHVIAIEDAEYPSSPARVPLAACVGFGE